MLLALAGKCRQGLTWCTRLSQGGPAQGWRGQLRLCAVGDGVLRAHQCGRLDAALWKVLPGEALLPHVAAYIDVLATHPASHAPRER